MLWLSDLCCLTKGYDWVHHLTSWLGSLATQLSKVPNASSGMCKHYARADDTLAECLRLLVYMQLYDTGYLLYCPNCVGPVGLEKRGFHKGTRRWARRARKTWFS